MTHPGIRAALAAAAEEIEPRPRLRPSLWAAANLAISPRESPERPGPIDTAYLPWTAAIMDLRHDHPAKRGAVIRKRSQVGVSISMMALLAYEAAHVGGPMLYAISDHREAGNMADARIVPMLESCPRLADGLGRAQQDERRLLTEIPYAGGRIDVVGGGSAAKFSTRPYRLIILDEWANITANFPVARFGSPHGFVTGRLGSFTADTFEIYLGHPTVAGKDIDELFARESDCGAWVFDCPHCGHAVAPQWHTHVVFTAKDPIGDDDPESAEFVCDACGGVISDQQRRDAVWPAEGRPGGRPGGSGRIEPGAQPMASGETIGPAEQRRRPYAGVHISGLCSPRVTVRALAREWVRAKRGGDSGQAWLNTRAGEPIAPAKQRLTIEDLTRCIAAGAERLGPAAARLAPVPGEDRPGAIEPLALGVRLIAAGVDVQAPLDAPTFYTRVNGYSGAGRVYSLHFGRIGGAESWEALARWAELVEVPILDAAGQTVGLAGLEALAIDAGYLTRAVLSWARRTLYSRATSRRILIVPVRFSAKLAGDQPFAEAPETKQYDPERPHLGPLRHYYAHRHTWVDREVQAWAQGMVTAMHPLSPEMLSHLRSQVLQPIKSQHGLEGTREEWQVAKGVRDDWLMSGAYATLGAAIAGRLGVLTQLTPLARRVGAAARTQATTRARRASGGAAGGGGEDWGPPVDFEAG